MYSRSHHYYPLKMQHPRVIITLTLYIPFFAVCFFGCFGAVYVKDLLSGLGFSTPNKEANLFLKWIKMKIHECGKKCVTNFFLNKRAFEIKRKKISPKENFVISYFAIYIRALRIIMTSIFPLENGLKI